MLFFYSDYKNKVFFNQINQYELHITEKILDYLQLELHEFEQV